MGILGLVAGLVGLAASGSALVTPPPPPQPLAGFHTERIECIVYGYRRDALVDGQLICAIRGRGRNVSMWARGRAQTWINPPAADDPAYGAYLRVGRSWRIGQAFRCYRGAMRLTCRNRARHGWVLGPRARVHLF